MSKVITSGYGVSQLVPTSGYGGSASSGGPGGIPFQFDSVELHSDVVLRVRFTRQPDPAYADASYYTLTSTSGAAVPAILAISAASDDDEVFDFHLAAPLPVGTYLMVVDAGVSSIEGYPLQAPYGYSFVVAEVNQGGIDLGASSDSCEDVVSKAFNPAFRSKPKWKAVIGAIALGDCIVRRNADLASRQLHISTASGRYLTKRAADHGVSRPENTGISDDLFRQLATTVINDKLTQPSFLAMLEVLYGSDSVRAYTETSSEAPFVMSHGSTLDILVDERAAIHVTFQRSDFRIMRRATAQEVASAITRAAEEAGTTAYAVAITDPITGGDKVRIYSNTRGLRSAVRITSGTAQPALQLPTALFTEENALPTWTIAALSEGKAQLTLSSDVTYNLAEVEPGDYVVISGVEFNVGNRGSFVIEDVSYQFLPGDVLEQYIIISNDDAVTQTVVQGAFESASFFRPTRRTPYHSAGYAIVTQHGGTSAVSIPATTSAVNRTQGEAAYLNVADSIEVTDLMRDSLGVVTVTTSTAHGLAPGDWFYLDDFAPDFADFPTIAGTPAGAPDGTGVAEGVSDACEGTVLSADETLARSEFQAITDLDGDLAVVGGITEIFGRVAKHTVAWLNASRRDEPAPNYHQHDYRWRVATDAAIPGVGGAVAVLSHALYRNQLLVCGGYDNDFWSNFASANFKESSRVIKETSAPWASIETPTGTPHAGADGVAVELAGPEAVLYIGGSSTRNVATDEVSIYDEATDTWSVGAGLVVARSQAAAVALDDDTALVIGGRAPASDWRRAALGYTTWDFDDAFGALTFAGPVALGTANATRVPGKTGWGIQCVAGTVNNSGGPDAALNAALLGDYTISGWMSATFQGVVFKNGVTTWASAADNTLIAFGVDPADDTFFIRWQYGAGTTVTKKTTGTRTALMGSDFGSGRYHHFAITKTVDGSDATFTLYVNGVEAGTWTDNKPTSGANGLWNFSAPDGAIARSLACIDAVGITATVLSAAEVFAQYVDEVGVSYEAPSGGPYLSPVGKVLNSCEVVDSSGAGSRVGSMSVARYGAGVVKLPDGRVLVAGGIGYNPSSGPSCSITAAKLASGGIGYTLCNNGAPDAPAVALELRGAEVYDPELRIWTPIADMAEPHSFPAMSYDAATNRVYILGGYTSTKVEYLDVATMTWHVSPAVWPLQHTASNVYPAPTPAARAGGGRAGDTVVLVGGSYLSGTPVGTFRNETQALHLDPGAETKWAGGIDGLAKALDGTTGTTLVFETPNYKHWTTCNAEPPAPYIAADAVPTPPGPVALSRSYFTPGLEGATYPPYVITGDYIPSETMAVDFDQLPGTQMRITVSGYHDLSIISGTGWSTGAITFDWAIHLDGPGTTPTALWSTPWVSPLPTEFLAPGSVIAKPSGVHQLILGCKMPSHGFTNPPHSPAIWDCLIMLETF